MKISSRRPWRAGVIASPDIRNGRNGRKAPRQSSNVRLDIIRRDIGSGFRVDMCVISDSENPCVQADNVESPTHTHSTC